MFSFFRWNAQAQIPPKDSFIQKYRFAFGKRLTLKAFCAYPACGLLPMCLVKTDRRRGAVWGQRGYVLPSQEPWGSHVHLVMLQLPAERRQPRCQSSRCAEAVPSGALYPSTCVERGYAVMISLCCQGGLLRLLRAVPCFRLQGAIPDCLEFRNLFQLRNVLFCVALTPFANYC